MRFFYALLGGPFQVLNCVVLVWLGAEGAGGVVLKSVIHETVLWHDVRVTFLTLHMICTSYIKPRM